MKKKTTDPHPPLNNPILQKNNDQQHLTVKKYNDPASPLNIPIVEDYNGQQPPKSPQQNLTAKKSQSTPQLQPQPQLQVHMFLSETPNFLSKSTIFNYKYDNLDITIHLLNNINFANNYANNYIKTSFANNYANTYIKTSLNRLNNLYIIKNADVIVSSKNHKIINISILPNITNDELNVEIKKLINTPSQKGGFYKKYFKYKDKYLRLKNQKGGNYC